MKFDLLFLSLGFVFFTTSVQAQGFCPFEDTPVCAVPTHCQQAEYGAGKVPYECEVGQSFKTRCTIKPSLYVYQYEGKCQKPRPKEQIQVVMNEREQCLKPAISGLKAVKAAQSKGLKFPQNGWVMAEYSEGSFYPDKPFPGCLWSLRVASKKSPASEGVSLSQLVYFVNGDSGAVVVQDPKKYVAFKASKRQPASVKAAKKSKKDKVKKKKK